MPWAIESLQVVWFKHDLQNIDARSVFEAAFGGEPDSFQLNRSVSPQVPFLSSASATRDGRVDRTQVSPGRVDLYLLPEPSQAPLAGVPGNPDELISQRAAIFAKTAPLVGNCIRIALIANMVEQAASLEQASQSVAAFFETKTWPDALDASFQLNRRTPFRTAPDELMNRLLRMNNVAVQGFAFQPQAGKFAANVPSSILAHGRQYMIDLNLSPTGLEFAPDVQVAMFGELVAEARRILLSNTLAEALG